MQDDGESYANDQPGDDYYDVSIDRFRALIGPQLATMIPDFDHERFAARATDAVAVNGSSIVHAPKEVVHIRLQNVIDGIDDMNHRARFANEVLVLLEGLTLIQRGGE